jgi:N-acetylglucosamine repressor
MTAPTGRSSQRETIYGAAPRLSTARAGAPVVFHLDAPARHPPYCPTIRQSAAVPPMIARSSDRAGAPQKRIPPTPVRVAHRGTSRAINRQILLNLVRASQPVSRADLARLMGTRRGAISLIVNDLIDEGVLFEGAKGETARGRKPKFLYIDSRNRSVVAVDVRATRTSMMVTDLLTEPVVGVSSFPTQRDAGRFLKTLALRIRRLLDQHQDLGRCEGVGVVVPGMLDPTGARIAFAPRLGWRDVPLRDLLAKAIGLPVHIENSGRACAIAQAWGVRRETGRTSDFVFLSVSDGLGVGLVVNGEVLRGRHNVAGEFGHTPLDIDGPPCACGATGCWEAYVSNLATLSRYFGREISPRLPLPLEIASFTVEDLVARARGGDAKAMAALQATARYLGLGLASVVNAVDPSRIFISGEIVAGWDLLESTVRQALATRVLAPAALSIEITAVPAPDQPRLRGAAALVTAPIFAAPRVG